MNTNIGFILVFIFISIILWFLETKDKKKLDKKRLQFHKQLKDALRKENIKNSSHVTKLYASIVNSNYFYLIIWSKQVLFNLDKKDNTNFELLDKIIDTMEFSKPFDNLPNEEKNILLELLNDKSENIKLFENKLHRLSDIIQLKYIEKNKSDKLITRLTIASFILAIYGTATSFWHTS